MLSFPPTDLLPLPLLPPLATSGPDLRVVAAFTGDTARVLPLSGAAFEDLLAPLVPPLPKNRTSFVGDTRGGCGRGMARLAAFDVRLPVSVETCGKSTDPLDFLVAAEGADDADDGEGCFRLTVGSVCI